MKTELIYTITWVYADMGTDPMEQDYLYMEVKTMGQLICEVRRLRREGAIYNIDMCKRESCSMWWMSNKSLQSIA